MTTEEYQEIIRSSFMTNNWNDYADLFERILNKAKETGDIELAKERGSKFIESLLADYKEEDIKNEKEREAFVRLRDIVKKY